MEYVLNKDSGSYPLPKLTLAIRENMDALNKKIANTNIALSERIKAQHDFIVGTIGAEATKEILGTDNINEMDVNELCILYIDICKAYDKPFNEAKKTEINPADRELVLELLKNSGNIKNMAARNVMQFGR